MILLFFQPFTINDKYLPSHNVNAHYRGNLAFNIINENLVRVSNTRSQLPFFQDRSGLESSDRVPNTRRAFKSFDNLDTPYKGNLDSNMMDENWVGLLRKISQLPHLTDPGQFASIDGIPQTKRHLKTKRNFTSAPQLSLISDLSLLRTLIKMKAEGFDIRTTRADKVCLHGFQSRQMLNNGIKIKFHMLNQSYFTSSFRE